MITAFRGRWARLSNYSVCTIFYRGHAYASTEHAYQAARFGDVQMKKLVRDQPSANTAKQTAHRFMHLTRSDWDDIKIDVMHDLLREKFSQEPERSILLSTGEEELVEGNWWHDNFWGDCKCARPDCAPPGSNWLGKLLMEVRTELKTGAIIPPSEEVWRLT